MPTPVSLGSVALLSRRVCVLAGAAWLVSAAQAQVLSSPVPGVIPHGTGAGEHSPLSPIAPLKPREDVVPWSVLTDIGTKVDVRRIVPVFPPEVLGLNEKKIRIQGFMMPLEAGEMQRRFLITSVPLTCQFCTPGGPESMVEVRTAKPVKYTTSAVAVEGKFWVMEKDPQGLYYRLTDAVSVR
jgi:hypothetical protein